MQFITRLSGNPIALATLLVSVVSLVIGSYLGEHSLIGVGLVGAAMASTTTLVIDFLSKPRIRDVPTSFQQAALEDFESIKYYRTSCFVNISLSDNSKVTFTMRSRIKRFASGGSVTTGKIQPQHRNIVGVERQSHKFNSLVPDPTGWPVAGDCSEELQVIYIVKPDFDVISEDHAWKSPVDGFELEISAPEGYNVSAQTLSQHALGNLVGGSRTNHRIYHVEALFSHQGFKWAIERQS